MPIGAIIGGVASIGGAILGSKSNSKAIDKASDAQAAASHEANQLQRDVYNQNTQIQQPFLNTGMAAMGNINALLGLNVPQSAAPPQTLPSNETQEPASGTGDFFTSALVRSWQQRIASGQATIDQAPAFVRQHLQSAVPATPATPAAATPPVSQTSAQDAYNAFKNYTGYTSRINEANDSFNSRAAGAGTLQSGAALIARDRMNQDYASNEFGNYMGYLGGQQQLGPGAANALAGVGTNYANAAGAIAQNQGNNAASAAIAQGNATSNMWGGIAGAAGGALGSIFGKSSFSDERLKGGITTIRIRSDGLSVKSWFYLNDPERRRHEGFVAQDVAKIYPNAVIHNFKGTGFLGVDYAEIPAEQGVAA